MNGLTFDGRLLPLAGLASLAIGAVSLTMLRTLLRSGLFRRQASARFALWFGLVVALTCSAPIVFFSGSLWVERVREVTISAYVAPPNAPVARTAMTAPVRGGINTATAIAMIWFAGFLAALLRVGAGVAHLRRIRRRAET